MAKNIETIQLYTTDGEKLIGGEIKNTWDIYPRPQLKRDSFFSLNGKWEIETDKGKEDILVPFPPESVLSGVGRIIDENPKYTYKKSFTLPDGFVKDRVILHFGAVDQVCEIKLNGKLVGAHIGGYDAFSFDITDALEAENTLEVYVEDNLDSHILPYGKQKNNRGGMWYTPVSGIWQTVWVESVPKKYISALDIKVTLDTATITFEGISDGKVTVKTENGEICADVIDSVATIKIENPKNWTPEDPYLYNFIAESGSDKIESYFALRTLEVKTVDGVSRMCLNGKPYFFHAMLDQGYFPDGIFTPATPECYEGDVLFAKAHGFNTLRKHIKVEPECFYYYCDKHGIIVFQDMVNNGHYSFMRDTVLPTFGMKNFPDKKLHKDERSRKAFRDGMKATVNQLKNHPSICLWTVFNEGWGQFDAENMYFEMKALDSSRFIDTASGWFKAKNTDIESEHIYFKPVKLKKNEKPIFISEFGGYTYKEKGHVFNEQKTYGYGKFADRAEFEDAFVKLYEEQIVPYIGMGLCATVYTQISDVEDETNGLISYDRKFSKVSQERMCQLAKKLKI